MREEAGGLGGAADGAQVRGDPDAIAGAGEDGFVGAVEDGAVVGTGEAGDGAEDGGFAAAGGAEEDGPGAGEGEVDVEGEAVVTVADAGGEVGGGFRPEVRQGRRSCC